MAKPNVLITGCSDGGLGAALALAFHAKGLRVIATARNPNKLSQMTAAGIETVILDVLSTKSIEAAVKQTSELTGGTLDILVNNSGGTYNMPIMDADINEARKHFDLNVWSYLEVSQKFLPLLLAAAEKQPAGMKPMVVNNTSIASVLSLPGQGLYNASKGAIARIMDVARIELQAFGVNVVDLKTGAVSSNFFNNLNQAESASAPKLPQGSIYEPIRAEAEKNMRGDTLSVGAMPSDVWAKNVVNDLMKTPSSPPIQIWRGKDATTVWFGTSFLPFAAFDNTVKKMSGLDKLPARLEEEKKNR